jgi:hypothetical protein
MNPLFIAKLILFGGLIIVCSLTLSILSTVDKQDSCSCAQSWKSKLLAVFCYMIIIMAAINLFVPLNSLISKIPLIGNLFSLILVIILALQIWLTTSVFSDIDGCKSCEISGMSAKFMNVLQGFSLTFYIIAVIAIAYVSVVL